MPKEVVYLDACGWLAMYKPQEKLTGEQRTGLSLLMKDVETGRVAMVGSTLLITQLLTVSAQDIQRAFDGTKGVLIALDEPIALRARQLQNECYKDGRRLLSHEDAVHLATASVSGCRRFITLDFRQKGNNLAPLRDRGMIQKHLGLRILDPAELIDQQVLDYEDLG